MEKQTELRVQVDAQGAEPEEIVELTRHLRRELLELDVDTAEPAAGVEAPPGTRAVDAIALGGLIVSLTNASGLLASVVNAIQSWVSGHGPRSVKLELDGDVLEVSGISSRRQDQLIKVWLDRHAGRAVP
jgi:anthranilate phosphoribosyltransferase